jgi:tetratricopeptide (TPR) repeat protein
VLVLIVAGVVWVIAPALRPPGTMDGIFNIAIAEFAEIGGDGKVADTSTAGHLLSQWTSEQLQAEFDQNAPELKTLLWRDSAELQSKKNVRLGVVADDPSAGVEAPATLARRVKADVVVYGVITPRPNGFAELQIKLYVAQPLDRDFGAMTGRYALGIPLLFKRDDPGAEVQETLKRQARGMGQVMLAVAYSRSNQSPETIDALEKAQESLGDSDVIAYLLGQEHLFFAQQELADREQNIELARQAFVKSISLNPTYARANIGLGSVFFTQAQDTLAATYSDQFSNSKEDAYRTVLDQIEPAIQNYQRAVEQSGSGAPDDDFLATTARIGLGTSYRIKGEALYRLGDSAGAQQWIAEAVNTLEMATQSLAGVQDYRVRAQAYQGLGTAYEWQAFLNGNAPAMLQQALSAYNQCIEQGDLSPLDTFLKDEIIAKLCVPNLNRLTATPGGGP